MRLIPRARRAGSLAAAVLAATLLLAPAATADDAPTPEPTGSIDGPPTQQDATTSQNPGARGEPLIAPMAMVGGGRHIDGILGHGTTWAGALQNTGGLPNVPSHFLFWCIQSGLVAPDHPVVLDATIEDPVLGYLLTLKQNDTSLLWEEALASLVHIRQDIGTGEVPGDVRRSAWKRVIARDHSDIQALMDQYSAEAAANAGPYTADLSFDVAANGRTGVVHAAIIGGAGTPVTGRPYTLRITGGAATWAQTGTKDLEVVADGSHQEFEVTASATGKVSVVLEAHGLPATTLAVGDPQDPDLQKVVAATTPTSLKDTTTAAMRYDFKPAATSKVPAHVVDFADAIADTLTVYADGDAPWISLDGKPIPVPFHGVAYTTGTTPAPRPGAVPKDAEQVATADIVANGPGTYTIPEINGIDPGALTWVWRVDDAALAEEHHKYVVGGWVDQYGLADETTIVRAKLEIDSSLAPHATKSGLYLVDSQWVKGAPGDHGDYEGGQHWASDVDTYSNRMHFIPGAQLPGPDSCTAETVIGESIDVEATNGFKPSIGSPTWLVDEDVEGTYVLVHSFPGDSRVMDLTSACDDPTQQYHHTPEGIEVTTKIVASTDQPVAGDGGTLTDTHLVRRTVRPGDNGYSTLYYAPPGQELRCTPENAVWTSKPVEYRNDAGEWAPGDYTVPDGFAYGDKAGQYSFGETSVNESGQLIASEECGSKAQTIVVLPASPATSPEPTPTPVPTATGTTASPVLAQTGASALIAGAVAVGLVGAGVLIIHMRARRDNA